ncbi:hypothetical protein M0R45_001040 [Rubus argutus]|uniref:Kinesin motor domain-containing protein n=1 Tax=Rubus argutus TaxID=59490 RepID=A0AAW1VR99_RUBAR
MRVKPIREEITPELIAKEFPLLKTCTTSISGFCRHGENMRNDEWDNILSNLKDTDENVFLREKCNSLQEYSSSILEENHSLQEYSSSIFKENQSLQKENRNLLNQIHDLKGKIRLYCRVGPGQSNPNLHFSGESLTVDGHRFSFDKLFRQNIKQEDVYTEIKPLIMGVLEGYKVCILAYGQSGSGKTYTMVTQGDDQLPDATSFLVNSSDDIFTYMEFGQANRAVGATNLNESSSRSHSVLTVTVVGRQLDQQSCIMGCLQLVDLAGSKKLDQSLAVGERQKETCEINKSLTALALVIEALKKNEEHIPYRNCKLTEVLQGSLGNVKTPSGIHVLLLCVSLQNST